MFLTFLEVNLHFPKIKWLFLIIPPETMSFVYSEKCDQKKIAKSLQKLPKNDFTRKMKDFDTFTKIA